MNPKDVSYTLPAAMVQSLKNVLDQIPGTPVRHLHNQLDAEIARQNEYRMRQESEPRVSGGTAEEPSRIALPDM